MNWIRSPRGKVIINIRYPLFSRHYHNWGNSELRYYEHRKHPRFILVTVGGRDTVGNKLGAEWLFDIRERRSVFIDPTIPKRNGKFPALKTLSEFEEVFSTRL